MTMLSGPLRTQPIQEGNMGIRHYVVQTHPCEEKLALQEITGAGFWTCWLASQESYCVKNVTRWLTVPTFPGYLFVGFDVDDPRWRTIAQMRGVRRILGTDPLRPYALPAGAVDQLRARFDAGEFKVQPPAPLSVGERVMVEVGPGSNTPGVVRESRGERIKVLMQFLGSEREIEMWSGRVRRAAE